MRDNSQNTMFKVTGRFNQEFMNALYTTLNINPNLKVIEFSYNHLGDEGMRAISSVLKPHKNLRDLTIMHNDISDKGAASLALMLNSMQNLKFLSLEDNDIYDEGAKSLAEALKENKTLEVIILQSNDLNRGGTGLIHIADMLKVNKTLTHINLTNCCVNAQGAKYLAEAIEVNTTLKKIDIDEIKRISENECAIAVGHIAQALKVNKTLTEINLPYNQKALDEVVAAVKVNYNLISVGSNWNKVSDINGYLIRNRNLRNLIPTAQVEMVSEIVMNDILPAIPLTLQNLIAEYDDKGIIPRIGDKLDTSSANNKTLNVIFGENNLSPIIDKEKSILPTLSDANLVLAKKLQQESEQKERNDEQSVKNSQTAQNKITTPENSILASSQPLTTDMQESTNSTSKRPSPTISPKSSSKALKGDENQSPSPK